MTAHSKFVILLAIFLLASYANTFLHMSPVTVNQVWENHLIRFEDSMIKQKKKSSRDPTHKPSN